MPDDNIARIKGVREDYKKVFSSEEGQKVLADLERVCLFRTSTFNREPLTMAFQEGLRGVYLHILTILTLNIEELEKLNASAQSGQ
jgi:hypothetical protein